MPSPEPPPRGFAAWHHFLSRALDGTKADGFDVQCFVRLGERPLEADVILPHLDPGADLHRFRRHVDFLVPLLRPCVVMKYHGGSGLSRSGRGRDRRAVGRGWRRSFSTLSVAPTLRRGRGHTRELRCA